MQRPEFTNYPQYVLEVVVDMPLGRYTYDAIPFSPNLCGSLNYNIILVFRITQEPLNGLS
jgi:hypothetical protein